MLLIIFFIIDLFFLVKLFCHYNDVMMIAMASQITSLTIVYRTVYSGADQRKHQSSASPAFVQGNHRGPVNSPHKCPVTPKMFPFDDVIMLPGYANKSRESLESTSVRDELNMICKMPTRSQPSMRYLFCLILNLTCLIYSNASDLSFPPELPVSQHGQHRG